VPLHRRFLAALTALIAAVALAACGSSSHTTSSTPTSTPSVPLPAVTAPAKKPCDPALGKGTMGACLPPGPEVAPQRLGAGARLIPDVSEFQGCALHSEAIVRVYEAGTERQDTRAACHLAELRRLHVWSAAYAFLRPGHGGCAFQADRTAAIVRRLGGITGPIVGDAEVGLGASFVRCFLSRVKQHHFAAVEYTCPGCGDAQVPPVWIASYPTRPPGHWVAHQFSDRFNCRGVFGDCSVNEGILSIRTRPPETAKQHAAKVRRERAGHTALLKQLEKQHGHLRTKLQKFGCSRRRHAHQRLGPRCRGWFTAGDHVVAHIAAERRILAKLR